MKMFERSRIFIVFSTDSLLTKKYCGQGISPNQAISDFLKQEIGGQIASIRNLLLKNKRQKGNADVDHSQSEQVIAQKAKLLIVPEAKIEKRGPRKEAIDREESDEQKASKDRKNFKETKTSPKGFGVRFETAAMGQEGTLYETYQEGKIIVVRWNTDHPFYDRVILANKDSKNIISALDYLIFALASAELKNINDENVKLLISLKSIMSANLRSLLS